MLDSLIRANDWFSSIGVSQKRDRLKLMIENVALITEHYENGTTDKLKDLISTPEAYYSMTDGLAIVDVMCSGDMMRKLILVEGLPGTGKTTISREISEYMSTSRRTHLYQEGERHPADLAWCACIPREQIDSIIIKYPDYETHIRKHTYMEDGYAIVPYTQFPIEDKSFFKLMESYEVYDNRVGYETFSKLHIRKWSRFGEQAKIEDDMTVFECAFLQNNVNELLLFHCMAEDQIKKYLLDLISTVRELDPTLIYLSQSNVYETLSKVSDIRVNEKDEKVWMERVISFIQGSPFGIAHSLYGYEGMVSYFEYRKKVELNTIANLPIETYIIENWNYNWKKAWSEIQEILDLKILKKT